MAGWEIVNCWKDTLNVHRATYEGLVEETERLALRTKAQDEKCQAFEKEAFKNRRFLMGRAYEALDNFVDELLRYTDGAANIGIAGVPSLPKVMEHFEALAQLGDAVVDTENLEQAENVQEFGENVQTMQHGNSLQVLIGAGLHGLEGAITVAKSKSDTNNYLHMQACTALKEARQRKDVIYYLIFDDSEVSAAVTICENNERNCYYIAEDSRNAWHQLQRFEWEFRAFINSRLPDLFSKLASLRNRIAVIYDRVGRERKINMECWLKCLTFKYHIEILTENTSRDIALRHVNKLIHTANKIIDGDSYVVSLKRGMEDKIREILSS
ncbi:hypothetical protein FQN57_005840 [Myotisia sp. PD_48]|nr:hypothetical protein FQN57_005840 [Myotisia sp. PD_48]